MRSLRLLRNLIIVVILLAFSLIFAAVEYKDGKVVFTFKAQAQVVYLAGTFNNWSPTAWPMKLVGDIWVYEAELQPGTYQYKFVIDGKVWKEDPEAPAYTDDGFGGKNGLFTLTPDGKILGATGTATAGKDTGKKYILNEKRQNTIFVDVDGYVVIRYYNKDAKQPFIAGTFNNWKADDTALYFIEDGWWEAVLELQPGIYEYKFVVDGNWIVDPNAFAFVDDGFGGQNGVFEVVREGGKLVVREPAGAVSAEKAEKPEAKVTETSTTKTEGLKPGLSIVDGKVMFVAKKDNAQEAYLAGTFNGWNPRGQKMQLIDGYWVMTLVLQPGVHKYKFVFVIGGNDVWEEDPYAPAYEPDGYGGKNGVFNLVQEDGILKIEGTESQSSGLPVKGKYEFSYLFQTNATNYLVFAGATSKLTLTFSPNPDLSVSVVYGGATLSTAKVLLKNNNMLVGFHYGQPWTFPASGKTTGKTTGVVLSYEFMKDTNLVFGLGYTSNKLPFIAGIEFGGIKLYGAKDYYVNNYYSVLGEFSLEVPMNISVAGLYNLNDTYYLVFSLGTEQFSISADFDGSKIGVESKVLFGENGIDISGSYNMVTNKTIVNVTYLSGIYKIGAGYESPTKSYLVFGLLDEEKGLSLRIENPNINNLAVNNITLSGSVSF
ncbi:MAG: glycoside hydrolase family 13 [Fervidobacterium gondwanense]|uniref:glycoside hydrolase family 13 n=1 Tax=Fervidobacterium gondwanense TaxID=44754 RepID=UPI0039601465